MLSVCIPTFNTNCCDLLETLHYQLSFLEDSVEVILADDCSTLFQTENKNKCDEFGFKYFNNSVNKGRIGTRLELAKKSAYDWILFLDADMLPKSTKFISNYLHSFKNQEPVIIGGLCYQNKRKPFNIRLRYGRNREAATLDIREKDPYTYIFFSNVSIRKALFFDVFNDLHNIGYGEDIYLAMKLKSDKISVRHIDNMAYHLGIENNSAFIKKIELSAKTLAALDKSGVIDLSQSKLISSYRLIKKFKLVTSTYICLLILSPMLKLLLVCFGGSLLFVDLYRLMHFINNR